VLFSLKKCMTIVEINVRHNNFQVTAVEALQLKILDKGCGLIDILCTLGPSCRQITAPAVQPVTKVIQEHKVVRVSAQKPLTCLILFKVVKAVGISTCREGITLFQVDELYGKAFKRFFGCDVCYRAFQFENGSLAVSRCHAEQAQEDERHFAMLV